MRAISVFAEAELAPDVRDLAAARARGLSAASSALHGLHAQEGFGQHRRDVRTTAPGPRPGGPHGLPVALEPRVERQRRRPRRCARIASRSACSWASAARAASREAARFVRRGGRSRRSGRPRRCASPRSAAGAATGSTLGGSRNAYSTIPHEAAATAAEASPSVMRRMVQLRSGGAGAQPAPPPMARPTASSGAPARSGRPACASPRWSGARRPP